jgi:hypothetical protein
MIIQPLTISVQCPLRVQAVWKHFSYPNNCEQPGVMDRDAIGRAYFCCIGPGVNPGAAAPISAKTTAGHQEGLRAIRSKEVWIPVEEDIEIASLRF